MMEVWYYVRFESLTYNVAVSQGLSQNTNYYLLLLYGLRGRRVNFCDPKTIVLGDCSTML